MAPQAHAELKALAALLDPLGRRAAADALAQQVGAEALLVFLWDEQVNAFVPAPGFKSTNAGGKVWREFFTRCEGGAFVRDELPFERHGKPVPVTALCDRGSIFAFIGHPSEDALSPLQTAIPLLGQLFHHEKNELEWAARARLANESALKAQQLSDALGAARAALEQALRESSAISREHAEQAAALRESEAQLRVLMKKLESSNRELQQFAYVAAHDLQEPLRTISSFCGLLEKRNAAQLDESGKTYLDFILKSSARALQLIQDLLALSRIGNSEMELHPVELQAAVDAACAALSASISEAGASVQTMPLPRVHGDLSQLSQLFGNLIGNAIKFRREAPPLIQISASEQPKAWKISVTDNGIGIRPEYYQRVFTIFQRLHTQNAYPGTGIGLAICKKIVERHGGDIGIQSEPNEGSTFFFTLPKRDVAATGLQPGLAA